MARRPDPDRRRAGVRAGRPTGVRGAGGVGRAPDPLGRPRPAGAVEQPDLDPPRTAGRGAARGTGDAADRGGGEHRGDQPRQLRSAAAGGQRGQLQRVLARRGPRPAPDVAHRRSAGRAHPAAVGGGPRENRGRTRRAEHAGPSSSPDTYADLSPWTRCISRGWNGIGSWYSSNYQIFQTPGYVVVFQELIHEPRIIPLDGRPHLPPSVTQWMGDSRGRWEGDTLVVETTNFDPKTSYQGSRDTLHLTERYTRVDADTIDYRFTVDDPRTFTRPWTVSRPMNRISDRVSISRVRVPRGELLDGRHPRRRPRRGAGGGAGGAVEVIRRAVGRIPPAWPVTGAVISPSVVHASAGRPRRG